MSTAGPLFIAPVGDVVVVIEVMIVDQSMKNCRLSFQMSKLKILLAIPDGDCMFLFEQRLSSHL